MVEGVNVWEDNLIFSRELMSKTRLFGDFNKVLISGVLVKDIEYIYSNNDVKFYESTVKVEKTDKSLIPIIVPDWLITNIGNLMKGKFIEVAGRFITRFITGTDGKRHSISKILVSDIKFFDNQNKLEVVNAIYLEGCILDPPSFCKERMKISFRVEVPRNNTITDYIRCIGYGTNASKSNEYAVGDKVKIYGRLVSREYFQKVSSNSDEKEKRISYEVEIVLIEKV